MGFISSAKVIAKKQAVIIKFSSIKDISNKSPFCFHFDKFSNSGVFLPHLFSTTKKSSDHMSG